MTDQNYIPKTIESILKGIQGPHLLKVSFPQDFIRKNQELQKKNFKTMYVQLNDAQNKVLGCVVDKTYEKFHNVVKDGSFINLYKFEVRELKLTKIITILDAELSTVQEFPWEQLENDLDLIDSLLQEEAKKKQLIQQTQPSQIRLIPTKGPSQFEEKPELTKQEFNQDEISIQKAPLPKSHFLLSKNKVSPHYKEPLDKKKAQEPDVTKSLFGNEEKNIPFLKENKKALITETKMTMSETKITPPRSPIKKEVLIKKETVDRKCDDFYYPISRLSYLDQNWIIKARVYGKSNSINFRRKDGSESCLFTINLIDADASEISAVFFDVSVVSKYINEIEIGKVYLLSGGTIKENNKRYGKSKNDLQIVFDPKSHIFLKHEENDPHIPKSAFEFAKIEEIHLMVSGTIVDVIGVVIKVGAMESIKLGDNRVVPIRKIDIYDNSKKSIQVVFWDYRAAINIDLYDILLVKGAKVKDYEKRASLTVTSQSEVLINANMPNVLHIKKFSTWFEQLSREELLKVSGKPTFIVDQILNVAELDIFDFAHTETVDIRAHITYLQTNRSNNTICSDCKRKSEEESKESEFLLFPQTNPEQQADVSENKEYTCQRCGRIYKNQISKLIVKVKLSDDTGSIIGTAFGRVAEELAAEELGYSTITASKSRTPAIVYSEFRVKLKCAPIYQDQRQFYIQRVIPLDYAKESYDIMNKLDSIHEGQSQKIKDLYDIF